MVKQSTYTILREALESLHFQGYTANIYLKNHCLKVRSCTCKLHNDEFEIDEVHHIEEPGQESNHTGLYAISSQKFNLKGLLIVNLQNPLRTISNQLATTLKIKQISQYQ